ncbi:substrate-binding domain-containing protein [Georgenia thermotolerans]|nr:substrate-binding domain-containing protein [Georgenia thermotolerans]
MATEVARPKAPALVRAARLLDVVAAQRAPVTLADLTRRLALPKSSVLNICNTLVAQRMLLRGHDGSFRLGPRIIELGAVVNGTERPVRLIGLTVQGAGPFFEAEVSAATEEAMNVGASIDAAHASHDPRVQERQIREFADAGAELIVVDPVDSQSLAGAAEYARTRGATLVAINGAAGGFDAAVTTDNTQAGFLAGTYFARRFPNGARIAVIGGTRVTAIADRIDGFTRALNERGAFSIVAHVTGDNTEATGYRLGTALLRKHPDLQGIFAINDPTASGASRACRERGVNVPIVGVDGSSEALAEITSGGGIVGTAVQDPRGLARVGVRFGLNLVFGAKPANQTVLLPTQLITASDAEGYEPW